MMMWWVKLCGQRRVGGREKWKRDSLKWCTSARGPTLLNLCCRGSRRRDLHPGIAASTHPASPQSMAFAPGLGPLPGCALEAWVGLTSPLSDLLRPRHSEWCNFGNVQPSGPSTAQSCRAPRVLFQRKICLYGLMRCSVCEESAVGCRTSDPSCRSYSLFLIALDLFFNWILELHASQH